MSTDLGFDPTIVHKWDPKTQAKVAQALGRALEIEPRAWYCKRGRKCDGKPHQGYDYPHARGDQWPPPGADWFVWLIISGRGAGKTRTGAEWCRYMSNHVGHIAGIGQTVKDIRRVMVEGESGLIRVCERAGVSYEWEPSKREFTFGNGSLMSFYSAEEPDSLRGPQHGAAWLDEPAHMPLIEDVWNMLMYGMRVLGEVDPKILCTSTPLPTTWLKRLMADPDTRTVRVSSYANIDNLATSFRKQVLSKFEGTRQGRQEIHGEVLEDVEGALWRWDDIEPYRTPEVDFRDMDRIVVGVDPAGSSHRRSDETGIVVVGQRGAEFYVFADGSGTMRPHAWATATMNLFDHYEADCIAAEKNYGNEMVHNTLANIDKFPRIKMVNSRRGKVTRAEPVVALYQQGRVHHVGIFEGLETQLTEWVPGEKDSPDRLDALVHAITELAKVGGETSVAVPAPVPMPRTGTTPNLRLVAPTGIRSVS